jgi:hypothetical protein
MKFNRRVLAAAAALSLGSTTFGQGRFSDGGGPSSQETVQNLRGQPFGQNSVINTPGNRIIDNNPNLGSQLNLSPNSPPNFINSGGNFSSGFNPQGGPSNQGFSTGGAGAGNFSQNSPNPAGFGMAPGFGASTGFGTTANPNFGTTNSFGTLNRPGSQSTAYDPFNPQMTRPNQGYNPNYADPWSPGVGQSGSSAATTNPNFNAPGSAQNMPSQFQGTTMQNATGQFPPRSGQTPTHRARVSGRHAQSIAAQVAAARAARQGRATPYSAQGYSGQGFGNQPGNLGGQQNSQFQGSYRPPTTGMGLNYGAQGNMPFGAGSAGGQGAARFGGMGATGTTGGAMSR